MEEDYEISVRDLLRQLRLILIFIGSSDLLLHVLQAHRLRGQVQMQVQLLIQLDLLQHDVFKEQVGFLIVDLGVQYPQHLVEIVPGQIELRAHTHRRILTDIQLVHFDDLLKLHAKLCNSGNVTYGLISDRQRTALNEILVERLHFVLLLLKVHSSICFHVLLLLGIFAYTSEIPVCLVKLGVILADFEEIVLAGSVDCQ